MADIQGRFRHDGTSTSLLHVNHIADSRLAIEQQLTPAATATNKLAAIL